MSKNPTHLWHFFVLPQARQMLPTMQPGHRLSFLRHLRRLVIADAPLELDFVNTLEGEEYRGIYKFRIGDYRVLFSLDSRSVIHQKHNYKGTVVITKIDWRKDIYRP